MIIQIGALKFRLQINSDDANNANFSVFGCRLKHRWRNRGGGAWA